MAVQKPLNLNPLFSIPITMQISTSISNSLNKPAHINMPQSAKHKYLQIDNAKNTS